MRNQKYNIKLFNAFVSTIEKVILPLTEQGVSDGNKVFGAAVLKKQGLNVICAETNNEMENPLFHGEIVALNKFFADHSYESPKDCFFCLPMSLAQCVYQQLPGLVLITFFICSATRTRAMNIIYHMI